jgi:hypothetical protein
LYLGTAKRNALDRIERGRNHHPIGELHPMVILTETQVLEIRKRYTEAPRKYGALIPLARDFNVSKECVYRIVHRRTWKHI